jgi:hypothetical protein
VTASVKYARLFRYGIKYGRKMFYNTGPCLLAADKKAMAIVLAFEMQYIESAK